MAVELDVKWCEIVFSVAVARVKRVGRSLKAPFVDSLYDVIKEEGREVSERSP